MRDETNQPIGPTRREAIKIGVGLLMLPATLTAGNADVKGAPVRGFVPEDTYPFFTDEWPELATGNQAAVRAHPPSLT